MEATLVIVMHNHRVIKDHPGEEGWMNLSEAFTFYNKVIKLSHHISYPSLLNFHSRSSTYMQH